MRRILLVLGLTGLFVSPALAFKEVWVSEGGASAVIIGSLTVELDGNGGKIVFENGKTLTLQKVPGKDGMYKVDPPQDPILRRGTRLCGMDAGVTDLEIGASGELERSLTVWSGTQHCAMYPMYEKNAYDRLLSE